MFLLSVNIYQITWRNIPENSLLHTCRRENLKSHQYIRLLRSCFIRSARSVKVKGITVAFLWLKLWVICSTHLGGAYVYTEIRVAAF
jgi:hypothetical protein